METRINKVYFLVPVVYLLVIFLLLMLQFAGGKLFQTSSGQIRVQGSLSVGGPGNGSSISNLTVEFKGLRFAFNSDNGIVVDQRSGKENTLHITGYNSIQNGFEVLFNQGAKLKFMSTGKSGDGLQVEPMLPQSFAPVSSITLPFGLQNATITKPDRNIPVFSVTVGTEQYLLTLPSRSNITPEKNRLILASGNETPIIRYIVAPPSTKDFFTLWFQSQDLKVSETEYSTAIQNYINVAYQGWATKRYDPATGTWSNRDGTHAFSEAILTAYLAEAWKRDDYVRAYTEMRTAADKHPADVSYLSSVFLGNLTEMNQKLIVSDQQESARLAKLVGQGDIQVFRTPHAIRFAADRGTQELYSSLLQFAAKVDLANVDVITALGLAQNALDASQLSSDAGSATSRFLDLINTVVIPNIVKTDQGFFVQESTGHIELYYSIMAGRLLMNVGQVRQDQRLLLMGRNLVLSALDFADDQGFLPQVLVVENGTVKESQGNVGPEDIYPLITTNPYYPREISLFNQAGQGTWLWTIMGIKSETFTQKQWNLQLTYQPNRTQYLLFEGVPSFQEMKLFGFDGPWRDDPQFESYSKGRYYLPSTKTLMIKYLDDTPDHSIEIDF